MVVQDVAVIRLVLLVVHALVVGLTFGLFVLAVVFEDPEGGANIGAGILLLALMAFGSPWSWPMFPADDLSGPLWAAAILATALLNLALHAWWVRRRARRAAPLAAS